MAHLKTTAWQYLRWPVAVFFWRRMGRVYFLFFLHSKGNCDEWCLITKFEYVHVCGMTTLHQAVGNDMKTYSLHLIFTFYLNRVTLVLVIVPFVVFRQKQLFNQSVLTHWGTDWQLKLYVSKIVGLRSKDPKWRSYQYILLQTRPHIMTINQHLTPFFCPQLIRNVRTVGRVDSSSIIAHPVNFYTVGGVAKSMMPITPFILV